MEDSTNKTAQGHLILTNEWREWAVSQKKLFKHNGRTNWMALEAVLRNHFCLRPKIDSLYLRNQVNSYLVRLIFILIFQVQQQNAIGVE